MQTLAKELPLFNGMSHNETESALYRLSADFKSFTTGERVLPENESRARMGVVLEGSVTEEFSDILGARYVNAILYKGEAFAESYALLGEALPGYSYTAAEPCRIMLLDAGKLLKSQPSGTNWQAKLMRNLLIAVSEKSMYLSEKTTCSAPKSARGRIMAYLTGMAVKTGGNDFLIPLDRQEMADYLNLDRTALSKELGKMKREGLISFRKNHFVININKKPLP